MVVFAFLFKEKGLIKNDDWETELKELGKGETACLSKTWLFVKHKKSCLPSGHSSLNGRGKSC